jgi:photosystem II stability/assembly factor-like uncharacterized protein
VERRRRPQWRRLAGAHRQGGPGPVTKAALQVALLAPAVAAAALLAPARPAAADVRTAHSGWAWASPQPQGQTIRALTFGGGLGYAAGRLGTVLRTEDRGRTWTGARTGTTSELTHVTVAGEDSVVAAGGCDVIRSDDRGRTFRSLPWISSASACPSQVAAIDFVDSQSGFIVLANGSVLRTGDGGRSWDPRVGIPQTLGPTGEADEPLAAAWNGPRTGVVVTSGGLVYRTEDGADSWDVVSAGHAALRTVSFATPTTAYAAGDAGTVLRSVDGGASWVSLLTVPVDVGLLRCSGDLACVAVSVDGRSLLQTTDGGLTYSLTPSGRRRMFAAGFATPDDVVASGEAGATFVSADTGRTWSEIGSELPATFSLVRAFGDGFGVAAGRSGALAFSADEGRSWTAVESPTDEEVIDVSFRSPANGLLLDAAGKVFRTFDGTAWERLHTGGATYPQAVVTAGRDVVVLVGPRGVWRSADEGDSFKPAAGRLVRRSKLFGGDAAGGRLFAYGSKVMLSSGDRGRHWSKVRMPRKALLAEVDFTSARSGYALAQNGRIWATRDRGEHWRELPGIGGDDTQGISFADRLHGYAVLSRFGDDPRGYVLRTSDGGRTWRPQLLTGSPLAPEGISAAPDGGPDLALATGNSLLYTDRGGDSGRPSTVRISAPRVVRRTSRVRVSGRLAGAPAGTEVLVSRRQRGESVWDSDTAIVDRHGRFRTDWRLGKTATFVAQWPGDGDQAGDGSTPVVVRAVRRR